MTVVADAPVAHAAARLLMVSASGELEHHGRDRLAKLLQPGDLLVANDAATIPASLRGIHERTGGEVEIRLAGRPTLRADDVHRFVAVVFGSGDWHTPTEHRPPPPVLLPGDGLRLGPLRATVTGWLDHPRLVLLDFDGDAARVWAGIAAHGRPIQYAHVPQRLALWDVWTPLAARPVAFEPPSAGFALRWATLDRLRARGVGFATLTHAAGISSTGDPALDARLPLDEPYCIPVRTARAVRQARRHGRRVIAIGTTVVRALEHAALATGEVRAGAGRATGRIGSETTLRAVHGILTGVHEPGTSHWEMLRALVDDATLSRMAHELDRAGYRHHEFGDSVLLLGRTPPGELAHQ
ncbi:MAG: S-adenosylmethionine:tRNA ribosyltransferase-isomerase [Gemmatimonadales bacterium]